jgi:hypothetical protein
MRLELAYLETHFSKGIPAVRHVIIEIRLHAHRGLLVKGNPVISSKGESCAIQVL